MSIIQISPYYNTQNNSAGFELSVNGTETVEEIKIMIKQQFPFNDSKHILVARCQDSDCQINYENWKYVNLIDNETLAYYGIPNKVNWIHIDERKINC